MKIDTKAKVYLAVVATLLLITGVFQAIKTINKWFDTHVIQFNKIVEVQFNKPIEIKERKLEVVEIVNIVNEIPLENLTPIEEYICEKWGAYECKVAIAVAKAEGLNHPPDGFNINTNGTIDVGVFRINSIHFDKEGCSLTEIVDPYKNVDCAYQIYEASGWNA